MMANLFDRLAGRTLGVVPVAQPLLAPVTAVASGMESLSTSLEAATESSRPAVESASPRVFDLHPSVTPSLRNVDETDDHLMAAQRSLTLPNPLLVEHPIAKPSAIEPVAISTTLAVTAFPAHQRSEVVNSTPMVNRNQKEAEPAATGDFQTQAFRVEPAVGRVEPLIRPVIQPSSPARQERIHREQGLVQIETGPPVIRVTIGRVEVRAQFPPDASPRPTARHKGAAPLSLEEYARQRSEGRR
jgi:hypothetical protein